MNTIESAQDGHPNPGTATDAAPRRRHSVVYIRVRDHSSIKIDPGGRNTGAQSEMVHEILVCSPTRGDFFVFATTSPGGQVEVSSTVEREPHQHSSRSVQTSQSGSGRSTVGDVCPAAFSGRHGERETGAEHDLANTLILLRQHRGG